MRIVNNAVDIAGCLRVRSTGAAATRRWTTLDLAPWASPVKVHTQTHTQTHTHTHRHTHTQTHTHTHTHTHTVSRSGSFDLSVEIIKPNGDEWKEKIAQAMRKTRKCPRKSSTSGRLHSTNILGHLLFRIYLRKKSRRPCLRSRGARPQMNTSTAPASSSGEVRS